MFYALLFACVGGCLLGLNNGINDVSFTFRNVLLFLAGMTCVFIGGFLLGKI